MDNDLLSIYEQHYLGSAPIINESTLPVAPETKVVEEAKKPNFKKKFKKKGDSKGSKFEIGAKTYNDSVSFDNLFDKIIKEEFGEEDAGDDSSFADDSDSYDFDDQGGDEQVSVSKATLQSIIDQLQGLIGDVGGEEEFGEDDIAADDEIPQESYGFEGAGKEHGMQGSYDGKAKPQGKSTHVKDNGDVNFNDQDTGYDPDDTEGSEGSEHGMQGTYDGKAKPQGKTDLVNGDGSINKSKQKHSAKTSSGKKDKNYF